MTKLIFVTFTVAVFLIAHSLADMAGCGPLPNKKNPFECCEVPMIVEKTLIDNCVEKHGKPSPPSAGGPPPGSPASGAPGGVCLMECVFNSTKAVTNGNIDVAALKSFMKGRYNGANEWAPIMEKAVDECVAEAAQKSGSMGPAPQGPENCDPKYGFILQCVGQKSFNNCPGAIYKASPECDELKKYSQKCPLPCKME